MKIAFLHYHLKTGGVTTVIRQQVRAIKTHCQVLVLSGEPSENQIDGPIACVPGLAYDALLPPDTSPETTAEDILNAMKKAFGTVCDVLHVHNPLLSKNKHLLKILNLLQEKGICLLLQIHDFAEDGRPHVYYTNQEYPENCHYAVINARDYHILIKAGLQTYGLHMLENAVSPLPVPPTDTPQSDFILYPVRAIRRKNIGEAVFLSQFFQNNAALMITQPPNSLEDIQSLKKWKEFLGLHRINILFDTGVGADFSALVAGARFLLTTSISEGFGFSFLEPWTAGKFLHGRLLPSICEDFTNHEVDLSHLYPALWVPTNWLDMEEFRSKWMGSMKLAMTHFCVSNDFIDYDELFHRLICNDKIDFGMLDETFQMKVLNRVISESDPKDLILRINPLLQNLNKAVDKDLIRTNKKAVTDYYHPDNYASKLLDIYTNVFNTPVSHKINKSTLLKQYLSPENLSLLKWGRYAV